MRSGYFKVQGDEHNATIIFAGAALKNVQVCRLRSWLDEHEYKGPVIYIPARRTVPITENGVSA